MLLSRHKIEVHAPLERCFALSTNVELVQRTLGMKLIGGVTSGSVGAESRVVWRGWKFGLPTEHHTLITVFTPPHEAVIDGESLRSAFFQDTQESGRFAAFHHDHFFTQRLAPGAPTLLEDRIYFDLPWGFAGKFPAKYLLLPHVARLAEERFAMLKRIAESSDEWKAYSPV